MLIKDTEKVVKRRQDDFIIEQRELNVETARASAKAAHLVNGKRSIANPEYQAGKALRSSEFLKKLQTINPNLTLDPHPGQRAPKNTQFYKLNHDKACLQLILPGGKKEFLFVCEAEFMPEWTIMTTGTTRVPVDKATGMWRDVSVPWNIEKRGWREVLVKLINKRLISLTAAERVFGPGDRVSWKILTGKGTGILAI